MQFSHFPTHEVIIMPKRIILIVAFIVCLFHFHHSGWSQDCGLILNPSDYKDYIDQFNRHDQEHYIQHFPNEKAWEFLSRNIPFLDYPDKEIEKTYYFRWWTFRKHIKATPDGFVITEFLPDVEWGGKYNTISCPAGLHYREGRWLHDPRFLDDYSIFWFRKGGEPRLYSFWVADSIWNRAKVLGDTTLAKELLPDLIENYLAWEREHLDECGLYWQFDGRDGGEMSISGAYHPTHRGYRPSINSFQFGDALAIASIAEQKGHKKLAQQFRRKAEEIKHRVESKLWDSNARFFKVVPRTDEEGPREFVLADVREQHGYVPWYFDLPASDKSDAWKQLMDMEGFYAPFGPTTAEKRHRLFTISYEGHECQWNGPSWPMATSITLTGLANLLNREGLEQDFVEFGRDAFYRTLKVYTKSHSLILEDGTTVPWIDENLNPFTGEWIARTRLITWANGTWSEEKGGVERGKDYNHSSYCDLIITGLIGLRPRMDHLIEINPIISASENIDYFCLDNLRYHGKILTIIYDKTGECYHRGQGLRIYADGKEIGHSPILTKLVVPSE